MKFGPLETTDKLGRKLIIRNAVPDDADEIIKSIEITASETPYLIKEPEDDLILHDDEVDFINGCIESDNMLLLAAFVDGDFAGGCLMGPVGEYKRYAHRCDVSISLYQKYCGAGIGFTLMGHLLEAAKKAGYEQAELEVVSTNKSAIALYEKFGFIKYGVMPKNMKYSDGSYVSSDWMMKEL